MSPEADCQMFWNRPFAPRWRAFLSALLGSRTLRVLAVAVALAVAASLVSSTASAHGGRLAADGCHNHRASGACHCHKVGASRSGCTGGNDVKAGATESSADKPSARGLDRGHLRRYRGAAESPAGQPSATIERIRIASWNLHVLHWRTGGALWRAAARVFPTREYALRFSGREDPRYDGIYTGFAVRKGRFDEVVSRPYKSLGLGSNSRYQPRWGADLTVRRNGGMLRLLNVHLKSRCFTKSLQKPPNRHCQKLARQVKPLEAWIDARWREGTPFVVLGDFNRAMDRYGPSDHLWRAVDDGDPSGLKLDRLPVGREPTCWRGTSRHHRHPIDFFVFGRRAWQKVDAASFRQLVWTGADADPRRGLPSDHCPITVDLF